MKLRIDSAGRIVVPKPLRQRLGLTVGQDLELVEQSNGLLLRPVRHAPALVKIDGVLVHQGVAEPNISDRIVDDAREDRIQQVLKTR